MSRNFLYCDGADALIASCEIGYHIFIGENKEQSIKLDLWHVDPFVFPINEVDGIRMADIREIAAFKLQAATQENRRQKDFWDINELLHYFPLEDLIGFAEKRYPFNFDRTEFIYSLANCHSVELAPEGIKCMRGNFWDLIVFDLEEKAKEYTPR